MRIDVVIALPNSVTIDPVYYNTTIKSFVSSVVSSFAASDEVQGSDARQFARFAVAQGSMWSRKVMPLLDRTRAELDLMVEGISYGATPDHGNTSVEWAINSADWVMDGDFVGYNLTSTTTNRVLIILVDNFQVTDEYEYLDETHKMWARFPYVIGIGLNGTAGNQIALDPTAMTQLVGGVPERVFPTLEAASDSRSGLLSLLSKYIACPTTTCSGFSFWFQDANIYWLTGKMFMDASSRLIPQLDSRNNGFSTMYVFGLHYAPVFYTQQGALDWLDWYQSFTSFLDGYTNTSRSVMFDAMIQAIESPMYNNHGFFILSETDSEDFDYPKAVQLAYKLQSYRIPIFVLDASTQFFEKQNLFKIITNNTAGRILNATDVTSTDDIVSFFGSSLVSEFSRLDCSPLSPVTPVSTPAPSTGPLKCSGVIFALEMSSFLTRTARLHFFALAKKVVAALGPGHHYGFAEFGIGLYRNSSLYSYKDIHGVIQGLEDAYSQTELPSAKVVYLKPMLDDIASTIQSDQYFPDFRFNVLMAAEVDGLWDPAYAYDEAQFLQEYEKLDVYVMDYSSFQFPSVLFPMLTGNRTGHLINGTSLGVNDFFNWLKPTFINDVQNNKC